MKTVQIIFTYRPISWRPISFINSITRMIQGHPRDHVVILIDDVVYEASFGVGVRKISYKEWMKDREGTDCIIYEVQRSGALLNKLLTLKYK